MWSVSCQPPELSPGELYWCSFYWVSLVVQFNLIFFNFALLLHWTDSWVMSLGRQSSKLSTCYLGCRNIVSASKCLASVQLYTNGFSLKKIRTQWFYFFCCLSAPCYRLSTNSLSKPSVGFLHHWVNFAAQFFFTRWGSQSGANPS